MNKQIPAAKPLLAALLPFPDENDYSYRIAFFDSYRNRCHLRRAPVFVDNSAIPAGFHPIGCDAALCLVLAGSRSVR
jgi:hypothetical protein